MRILVLGGTSFVGRAIVEQSRQRGDELTLFSRGRTGTALFPDLERRRGDRASGDYASLAGGIWDAVVDVSGYVPRHVREAADAVGDVGRYLFISTGSVYDKDLAPDSGLDEEVLRLAPERRTENVDGDTYGPLKVACEDDVQQRYGELATIVRPGIVGGPHDPTDRLTWWVRRAAAGGRVALPGRPAQPVQVADSRDLAVLVVQLLHDDRPGIYNAVGPREPVDLAGLIQTCADAADAAVEVVPVEQSAVEPDLPFVLADPSWDALFRRSAARAVAAGMPTTPLATTAADVLAWDRERGTPALSVGLSPEREAALLG